MALATRPYPNVCLRTLMAYKPTIHILFYFQNARESEKIDKNTKQQQLKPND